jgi:hypothetical protein
VIDGPALGRMTDAVVKLLPQDCEYDTVFKSLTPFLGSKLDLGALRDAAWALAANLPLLKKQVAPYPARVTAEPHPVTVQVLAARRLPAKKAADSFPVLYRGRIIKGFGCPLVFEWQWSSKFIAYKANRPDGFGFHRPEFNKPQTGRAYQHFSTLVGMRFAADLSAAEDGKKVLADVRCGAALREHNRALTEMRFRATFACPFELTHPCHHCPKGQASCPAACHPADYVTKVCGGCGKEAEHDEYWRLGVCTRCAGEGRRSLL